MSLRVLGKRDDGLHEICTTFQTISLCDYLTFEIADEIALDCDNAAIPIDENNLIVRAANHLRERFSISKGAKIRLEKNIPSPGGLGGGSSDAAVALLGLANLWEIKTTRGELIEIGKTLGADVPFFLFGGTAFATGLGTEIEILPDTPEKLLLVVTPNVAVSTAAAYQSLHAPRLTEADSLGILTICRAARIENIDANSRFANDFEKTIFALEPEIAAAKKALLNAGANAALISGSGGSVFGFFDNNATRRDALTKLSENADWKIFVCQTLSRNEYENALRPCLDLAN